MITPILRNEPASEQEPSSPNASATTVPFYDDGPSWPCSPDREQAFRQGFVEEARRLVRDWVDPNADTDPFDEELAARNLRRRVRERYTVYAPGTAGRKTHHLGYRPGHEVPVARLRGRHHALAYENQSWAEVEDFEAFDHLVLLAWITAVERWASGPTNRIACPPRPLEMEGTGAAFVSGNFFETVPVRCDLYTLFAVLHDWDDERCLPILKTISSAMALGGKILVVERPVSRNNGYDHVKAADLLMLVLGESGRERTISEYELLFGQANLQIVRRTTLPTLFEVFELTTQ